MHVDFVFTKYDCKIKAFLRIPQNTIVIITRNINFFHVRWYTIVNLLDIFDAVVHIFISNKH